MAFTATDGSKHTNHDTMRQANMRHSKPAPKPDMAEGEPDGDEGSDGAAMAQQHGPAVQIDIQHNHEAGSHTVHAMHPDGHEHETQHGSAMEAHKYAGDCAGAM